jgi:hypothetical protein
MLILLHLQATFSHLPRNNKKTPLSLSLSLSLSPNNKSSDPDTDDNFLLVPLSGFNNNRILVFFL